MSVPEIEGLCPPQFEAVREAFERNFATGEEVGARFALAIEGQVVECDVTGSMAPMLAVLEPAGVEHLSTRTASLEELFVARYGDGA